MSGRIGMPLIPYGYLVIQFYDPTIAGSVDTITSASEIWKALASMYLGVGNVMLLADTDHKIHYLKQGERTLMDYVAELK